MSADLHLQYREAWDRVFNLVAERNKLLHNLDLLARPAMDISLATGMIVRFDAARARTLVDRIDRLTPQISAGVEQINRLAKQTGGHILEWRSFPLEYDALEE